MEWDSWTLSVLPSVAWTAELPNKLAESDHSWPCLSLANQTSEPWILKPEISSLAPEEAQKADPGAL